jgi:hypothetical protein
MLSMKVTANSVSPSAKAASVLGLSNSASPVSRSTICLVTVVALAKGSSVMLAAPEAAITTIIVSPIARLTASSTPATTPGSAAGIRTLLIVSEVVAPIARLPSRIALGTAAIESSAIDETKGMIITPITSPAASALSDEA